MVHEEEEGVSMSLSMLLGQAARVALPAQDEELPDLPPPPPLSDRQVCITSTPAASAPPFQAMITLSECDLTFGQSDSFLWCSTCEVDLTFSCLAAVAA